MQLSFIDKRLSIRRVLSVFVLIIVSSSLAISIMIWSAPSLGELALTEAYYETVYQFSNFFYSQEDLTVFFPHGGNIVPVLRQNELIGAALFGEGGYRISVGNSPAHSIGAEIKPTEQIYFVLSSATYEKMVANLVLLKSDRVDLGQMALMLENTTRTSEVWFHPFTIPRYWPVNENQWIAHIFDLHHSTEPITYATAGGATVHYPGKTPQTLGTNDYTPYPTHRDIVLLSLCYVAFSTALVASLILWTADFQPKLQQSHKLILPVASWWIPLFILTGEIYLFSFEGTSTIHVVGFRLLAASVLCILFTIIKPQAIDLRLDMRRPLGKLVLAVSTGLALFIFATLQLPSGIDASRLSESLTTFKTVFWHTSWLAFIVFGLWQRIFERFMHPYVALTLFILLVTGLQLHGTLPYFYHNDLGVLLDIVLFMPLFLAIIGVVVIRTQNVLVGSLIISLTMALSHLILF